MLSCHEAKGTHTWSALLPRCLKLWQQTRTAVVPLSSVLHYSFQIPCCSLSLVFEAKAEQVPVNGFYHTITIHRTQAKLTICTHYLITDPGTKGVKCLGPPAPCTRNCEHPEGEGHKGGAPIHPIPISYDNIADRPPRSHSFVAEATRR